MAFRRRSSLALLTMSAIAGVSGAPVDSHSSERCEGGDQSKALVMMRRNSGDAVPMCEAHGVSAPQTTTTTEQETVLVGRQTVTSTVHAAPTLTMTVVKDYVATVTMSKDCESGSGAQVALQDDKRDSRWEHRLESFSGAEIQNACSCFMAGRTATETVTATPTTKARPKVTKAYTVMDGDPVVYTTTIGATRTAYQTMCA